MWGRVLCRSRRGWTPPATILTRGWCNAESVPFHERESAEGRTAFAKGREFLHTNQLNSAIREFKRAQLCFNEANISDAVCKADCLMDLGEALILSSDKKMLASGTIQNRFIFSADSYKQAMENFLKALSLYPTEESFSSKRALCWQKAGK